MAVVIILAGLFLRLLFPLERGFDFDQEQIAINAQRILAGNLTLIGPQTGPIQFFTGPLIYYMAAIGYWLTNGHPLANTLVETGIFLVTAVGLWLLLRRLVSAKMANIFIGIYSLSAYLLNFDQNTWNPNLSFLSSGLVLIGLLFPLGKLSYLAGFLGMWLAYQAHFSAFVMAAGVILICLWLWRWRFLVLSCLGLIISLMPTLVFDLRHNWINVKGVWLMVSNAEQISVGLSMQNRFFNQLFISMENITKIVIPVLPHWSLVGLGGLILVFWLAGKKSIFNQTQRLILLAWIFMFPSVMMFYRGSIPEYYFLMQLPAGVFILADLFLGFRAKLPVSVTLAGFCLIALGVVIQQTQILSVGPSLGNKLKALEYIKENQIDQPVDLVLDMEVKDRFGWNYLIDYLKISKGENSTKVHLIYPVNPGAILSARFGGIGVWFDKRGQVDLQAFVDDIHGILFYYPNDFWQLSEFKRIVYPQNPEIRIHAFAPQAKAGKAAVNASILFAYIPKNSAPKYFQVLDHEDKPGSLDRWQMVSLNQGQLTNRKTLTRERKEDLFIFSFPQGYTWKEIESFLARVEGI